MYAVFVEKFVKFLEIRYRHTLLVQMKIIITLSLLRVIRYYEFILQ